MHDLHITALVVCYVPIQPWELRIYIKMLLFEYIYVISSLLLHMCAIAAGQVSASFEFKNSIQVD
jgi:hypothetical protein